MHFFIKKFKFKFANSVIKQQCISTLQNFTNYSQCEIAKVKTKITDLSHHKHKSEKKKK